MPEPRKGRGALSNPSGRFDRTRVESIDDGWSPQDEMAPNPATTAEVDSARSILTHNDSPDVPFEQSINPYRGCEHGCVYCFARPSHSYVGLSPGLDFETRLFYKPDAARLLEVELLRPGYTCRPIAIGTNTDAYQPIERRLRLMRDILEVLLRCRHPVTITTKGALVERDIDLLAALAADGLVRVFVSLTTLDPALKRTLEPRAASAEARLRTLQRLAAAGVPAGVMVAPVIPVITDHELEAILEAAADAGARRAAYVLLRLPYEVKDLFREWLEVHHPQRAAHVMQRLCEQRGGREYDSSFGVRGTGRGPLAELLARRFELACRRFGLETGAFMSLRTDLFAPARLAGGSQLELEL